MITWLLLASLFYKSTQDGTGLENGVLHCKPQNLLLTTNDQTILLTWEDHPSCSALPDGLAFELLVLIADTQVHHEEFAVMPDQIGSTHSWNWTSHLALECASHSVRLRSRFNEHTSPWKQECTHPGTGDSDKPEVFPRDRIFQVGSKAIFCCIVPASNTFNRMYLMGYDDDSNMTTTRISNQTYILTVHLSRASDKSCTNVMCETNTSRRTHDNGACANIGYSPGDKDLECETRTLQSVECQWTAGRDTHLSYLSPTLYHLLGRRCVNASMGMCKMEVQVEGAGERNWTVTAQNHLGKVELSDSADLMERVHMFGPMGMVASTVNARNVNMEWRWMVQQYNSLNITCQVKVSHGETHTISEKFGVGLHSAILNDLIPHWTYNVTARCRTTQHWWKWGDWSESVHFLTKGDVPDAPDVWMQVKRHHIIIVWKMPLANQSHGYITHYAVTWSKATGSGQVNTTKVQNKQRLALSLDPSEEHVVTVTARNENGSSSPSIIIIPGIDQVRRNNVNLSQIISSNGSFHLSWSISPRSSCGYMVDWCPTFRHCKIEWLKVPPNKTSARIFSKKFLDGERYSLNVYACTQGAPVLLETREGYVSEKRLEDGLFKSLKWKQQDSDVEVSWDPIEPRHQSAFIQGYVLYCLDTITNRATNFSTDDPEASSLTARNLDITSYKFTVTAQTAVGESGTTSITATLNSLTDNLVKPVFMSMLAVFSLLSLVTALCYKYWTCIKHKVYPPIPKPVLTDKWLTSLGENGSCVNRCHYSEADIMDVYELHCNSATVENGNGSQEKRLLVFSQTPLGFYNQPLKESTRLDHLPSTASAAQSRLSSSFFTSVFPNPSYNLKTMSGEKQSNLGFEADEDTYSEQGSSGYQPQISRETFTVNQAESPMPCVPAYILLPQPHPK